MGDLAAHDRQLDLGAHELLLVGILGRDRHARVAEHGFGAGGGHDDVVLAVDGLDERVAQVPQTAVLVDVFGFVVGDGGRAVGAPVHDALALVDEAVVVPLHEELADRGDVVGVEGEVLVGIVAGAAHALDLLDDRGAVFAAPFVAGLDELLAADFKTADALLGELLVDLGLRGDTGVVGA